MNALCTHNSTGGLHDALFVSDGWDVLLALGSRWVSMGLDAIKRGLHIKCIEKTCERDGDGGRYELMSKWRSTAVESQKYGF